MKLITGYRQNYNNKDTRRFRWITNLTSLSSVLDVDLSYTMCRYEWDIISLVETLFLSCKHRCFGSKCTKIQSVLSSYLKVNKCQCNAWAIIDGNLPFAVSFMRVAQGKTRTFDNTRVTCQISATLNWKRRETTHWLLNKITRRMLFRDLVKVNFHTQFFPREMFSFLYL